MDLDHYQKEARKTDKTPSSKGKGIIIPLLGLAGEVGTLLSEYKKHLRDGKAHRLFHERLAEELGDILWYVANTASKFNLDLEGIAEINLAKTRERWPVGKDQTSLRLISHLLDEEFPKREQIPRRFRIQFEELTVGGKLKVCLSRGGQAVGEDLTDNAYYDDGYRFHDVFHLAYAAVLGWSPVTRKILKCKRRSNNVVDEVEDGGRAIVIEEAISAFVYDYARKHDFLKAVPSLDYNLLKTIKSFTADLEVRVRTYDEWEQAIFSGYRVWNKMRQAKRGTVSIDLSAKKIILMKPTVKKKHLNV